MIYIHMVAAGICCEIFAIHYISQDVDVLDAIGFIAVVFCKTNILHHLPQFPRNVASIRTPGSIWFSSFPT